MSPLFQHVANRGTPPQSFLDELLAWAKTEDDAVFAQNSVPVDVFTVIRGTLAPNGWTGLPQRKAALLETMRVHAGLESSWNFNEGVDTTNRSSVANVTGQESGIFQVSFDSEWIDHGAMKLFAAQHSIGTPENFILLMKKNHALAFAYYARLVRINIAWAGPLLRHDGNSIYPWLRRDAMDEFERLLTP